MVRKMMPLLCTFLLAVVVAPISYASGSSLTLVGVDGENNPIEVTVPSRRYQENLKTAVSAIHESTLEALSHQRSQKAWALKVVSVGVGANLELGIGSLLKASILPRFRLLFTQSNDPAVP